MLKNDLCLNYLEYRSAGFDESNPALIIFLHGRAANEQDLFDLAPKLTGNFVVLSVRAPIEMGSDSFAWFHTTYSEEGDPLHDPVEAEKARILLIEFIHEAQAAYDVPSAQTYLFGFSQGAILALGIALQAPDLISGVAALSGRILPEYQAAQSHPKGLKGFPILLSHGTEDGVLDVKYGRDARAYLEKLPLKLSYFEHPVGHDIKELNFNDVKSWFDVRLPKSSQVESNEN